MGAAEEVRARYLEVHGEHPMDADDDAYVREHFVPAGPEELRLAADGVVPLPSYLLSDGTPMVPRGLLDPVGWAGGPEHVHDWFLSHWPDDERSDAEVEWRAWLDGRYACLRDPVPLRVRQLATRTEQARAAIARLATDPRDPVARGSLAEAVDKLERQLLPMTGHDRLRTGRPPLLEVWVHDVRRDHLTPPRPDLPLRTERLLLRRARPDDAAAMHEYYGDPDVATYLLTEAWSLREAEHVLRGRVPEDDKLGLVVELDGRVVGDVVLMLQPPSWSVAEIGWSLHPAHAGRGIATEAANALLDLAFDHYGCHRVMALLDARNERSAALCERLGMRRESHRLRDFWSKGEWTDSLEYALLAGERRPGSPGASTRH